MPYYEARVSVTRVTTLRCNAATKQEAMDSLEAQISCWDGYSGYEIISIKESQSIKYKSVFQAYGKPSWKDRPPGKVNKEEVK